MLYRVVAESNGVVVSLGGGEVRFVAKHAQKRAKKRCLHPHQTDLHTDLLMQTIDQDASPVMKFIYLHEM